MTAHAGLADQLRALPMLDERETAARDLALGLLDSGVALIRGTDRPDRPDPHLVAYLAVLDGPWILLVAHRKSGLWLPPGGHVDPGETCEEAAAREALEELGIMAQFLQKGPAFITATPTIGAFPHRDLSLWYILRGDRTADYDWDKGEFTEIRWHPLSDLPERGAEPELPRFAAKLALIGTS